MQNLTCIQRSFKRKHKDIFCNDVEMRKFITNYNDEKLKIMKL